MGSFLNKGLRQNKVDKRKQAEAHVKGFYRTLAKVVEVSDKLSKLGIDIDESNVDAEASKILGRDLDSMERVMILGRLMKEENDNDIS